MIPFASETALAPALIVPPGGRVTVLMFVVPEHGAAVVLQEPLNGPK
jgi:hypothetical protein